MALRTFKCVECEKDFKEGQWSTGDGHAHKLESKTYFITTEGLTVTYAPELRTGDLSKVIRPDQALSFHRGTYTTDDPQKQNFLDKYPGCCTKEQWEATHLPAAELKEKAQRELKHNIAQVKSTNEELERVKLQLAAAHAELAGKSA